MKKIDPGLNEQLKMLVQSMGYELVGVEWIPQKGHTVFRIYIDSKNGVTVDDCSKVSHQVSALLDVEDPIQGRYSLEISSPGIDRPLFEIEQYQKYLGKRIKIRLSLPIQERRQYKGVLLRIAGDDIILWVEDRREEVTLPFSLIEKANLIGDIHLKQ